MDDLRKVREIIANELGLSPEIIGADTVLEELGIDSLEFVSLMQAIGKEIAEIPESKWERLRTVGDIARATSPISDF